MILKDNAQPYLIGEKLYCVGDLVYANRHSEYEGLFGRIIEIRDGEDKLSLSTGPEIVCPMSGIVTMFSSLEESACSKEKPF